MDRPPGHVQTKVVDLEKWPLVEVQLYSKFQSDREMNDEGKFDLLSEKSYRVGCSQRHFSKYISRYSCTNHRKRKPLASCSVPASLSDSPKNRRLRQESELFHSLRFIVRKELRCFCSSDQIKPLLIKLSLKKLEVNLLGLSSFPFITARFTRDCVSTDSNFTYVNLRA